VLAKQNNYFIFSHDSLTGIMTFSFMQLTCTTLTLEVLTAFCSTLGREESPCSSPSLGAPAAFRSIVDKNNPIVRSRIPEATADS
ncbi:hypothetical protein N1Z38_005333, partial [Klebsiella pneumoniae]